MAKKKQYYSIKNVLSTGAQWIILLGQRANGKSYQAKKLVLENAFKNHHKFIYLRRWESDIKESNVTSYFADMPILEITQGQYSGVMAYHGYIYFYNLDDEDKPVKGECIGRYCALRLNERYKSQVFDDYDYIVYEEFITDGLYLGDVDDEPRILQQFVSTVFRHKQGKVIMVGNTLSRVCPYFKEFCLVNTLKMKPGDIEIYHHHVGDATIDIAVEYCANIKYENTMFFGQASKQIISGEWDTKEVNKLPGNQEDYEEVYKILVEYMQFRFVMSLLVDKDGGKIVFVYPKTTENRNIDRILTDRFDTSPLISSRLDLNRKPEKYISDAFRLNKVCYSDNLTGSDFVHVNDHFKIASLF